MNNKYCFIRWKFRMLKRIIKEYFNPDKLTKKELAQIDATVKKMLE